MGTPVRLTKPQSGTELYTVEYAQVPRSYLQSGEVISSAAVVVHSGGLAISSVSWNNSQVFFYVSSGVTGELHSLDVMALTSRARTPVRSFELIINPISME